MEWKPKTLKVRNFVGLLVLPLAICVSAASYPGAVFSQSYQYDAHGRNSIRIPSYSGSILGAQVSGKSTRNVWDMDVDNEIFEIDKFERSEISKFQSPFFGTIPTTVYRTPTVVKQSSEYVATLVQDTPTQYVKSESVSNDLGYTGRSPPTKRIPRVSRSTSGSRPLTTST